MTVLSTPYAADAYTWSSEENPLTPFYKRDQMERAKYLEWILINVRHQVEAGIMDERRRDSGTANYNLSHLVKIAGQFPTLKLASDTISRMSKDENGSGNPESQKNGSGNPESNFPEMEGGEFTSALRTPLPFSEVVEHTQAEFWKRQHRFEIGPFFDNIFPRLRPGQKGFLPCIYRDHIQANGELVAAGSSIAIQLTERNYENMATANNPTVQRELEANMTQTEERAAPMLREELQGNRTVPPSQVAGLPVGRDANFIDAHHPHVLPETWEQQFDLMRYQTDPVAEASLRRLMDQKRFESELRMQEKRELARLKAEADDRSAANTMAIWDHKQQARTNSTTRSQSVGGSRTSRGGATAALDPTRFLIGQDWDQLNPTSAMQVMAIVIDQCFESSPRATEAVTAESFHQMLVSVLRGNLLGFESFEGKETVHDGPYYWSKEENIIKAKELIYTAKNNFPKSNMKEVTGAWDFRARDALIHKRPAMQYLKPRLDRIRMIFSPDESVAKE